MQNYDYGLRHLNFTFLLFLTCLSLIFWSGSWPFLLQSPYVKDDHSNSRVWYYWVIKYIRKWTAYVFLLELIPIQKLDLA